LSHNRRVGRKPGPGFLRLAADATETRTRHASFDLHYSRPTYPTQARADWKKDDPRSRRPCPSILIDLKIGYRSACARSRPKILTRVVSASRRPLMRRRETPRPACLTFRDSVSHQARRFHRGRPGSAGDLPRLRRRHLSDASHPSRRSMPMKLSTARVRQTIEQLKEQAAFEETVAIFRRQSGAAETREPVWRPHFLS
jgi:hypothetical protein